MCRFVGGDAGLDEVAFSEAITAGVGDEGFLGKLPSLHCDSGLKDGRGVRLMDGCDPDQPMEVAGGKTNIMRP